MNSAKTIQERVIVQDDSGYRYSIEPFLLADYVSLLPGQTVLDIGTGCGIIPLLMVFREPELSVTGIEIQESAARNAMDNVSRNKMKINIIHGDFLEKAGEMEQFDQIVSNPPYRKVKSGRTNPDPGKAIARHELTLNLQSMLDKAVPILKKGGHITLAYPPNRLLETLRELKSRELFPTRIRFIHGNLNAAAKIFLVDAIKDKKSDLSVDSPLYVYNSDGNYTQETQEIYASFNYTNGPDDIGKK